MQIIFTDNKDEIASRYTLLELETFTDTSGTAKTAYCVLGAESLPLAELVDLDRLLRLHQSVIDALKGENFNTAKEGIKYLLGKFNGELDSFYSAMIQRYDLLD